MARVVAVLFEPGPRGPLFCANSVRGPRRMGHRRAKDWGDDLRNDPGDGRPLRAIALRPERSVGVGRARRSRARSSAPLEGALPQRTVLSNPGGALLRHL